MAKLQVTCITTSRYVHAQALVIMRHAWSMRCPILKTLMSSSRAMRSWYKFPMQTKFRHKSETEYWNRIWSKYLHLKWWFWPEKEKIHPVYELQVQQSQCKRCAKVQCSSIIPQPCNIRNRALWITCMSDYTNQLNHWTQTLFRTVTESDENGNILEVNSLFPE